MRQQSPALCFTRESKRRLSAESAHRRGLCTLDRRTEQSNKFLSDTFRFSANAWLLHACHADKLS